MTLNPYEITHAFIEAAALVGLNKASSADFADVAPESLGRVAYQALHHPDGAGFAMTSRLIPAKPATQLNHQEPRITGSGYSSDNRGAVLEGGTPRRATGTRNRLSLWLKAHAQDVRLTVQAGNTVVVSDESGNSSAVAQEEFLANMRLAEYKSLNELHWDTRGSSVDEETALLGRGIFEQIERETAGTNPLGSKGDSNLIDCRGQVLTKEMIANYVTEVAQRNGRMPSVITLPASTHRLLSNAESPNARFTYGQNGLAVLPDVQFINVNGTNIPLVDDRDLSWERAAPKYVAPTSTSALPAPTVSAVVGTPSVSETSLWDADSDGQIFYVVRSMNENGEYGYGRRHATSTTSYLAVSAGDKVTLTITPPDGRAVSYAIYRGREGDGPSGAMTEAALIAHVAANGSNTVTWTDLNEVRPRTDRALALPIGGPIMGALTGQMAQGVNIQALNTQLLSGYPLYNEDAQMASPMPNASGVVRCILGPARMRVQQGIVGLTQHHYLIGQVSQVYVVGAAHALGFYNVGRPSGV